MSSQDYWNLLLENDMMGLLIQMANGHQIKDVSFEVNKASIYHLRASDLVGGN